MAQLAGNLDDHDNHVFIIGASANYRCDDDWK
jgi:hypothetical protein